MLKKIFYFCIVLIANLNADKLLTDGINDKALYLINPKNTKQKIILVGSIHVIPLNEYPKNLVKDLKAADILIEESSIADIPKSQSLQQNIEYFLNEIIKNNPSVIKNSINSTHKIMAEQPDKKLIPWADLLNASDKVMLTNILKKYLNGLDLSNFNPYVFIIILTTVFNLLYRSQGIDTDLVHFFTLSKKKIMNLETSKEKAELEIILSGNGKDNKRYTETELINAIKSYSDKPDKIYKITSIIKEKLSDSHDAKKKSSHEKSAFYRGLTDFDILTIENHCKAYLENKWVEARNRLWIPRIIKILNDNNTKSIALVVGIDHLCGNQGVIKLLQDNGFKTEAYK